MSLCEDYLCQFLPLLNLNIFMGHCTHTCTVRVTRGSKNPEEIGMHYRYVSVITLVRVVFYSFSPLVSSPTPVPLLQG
jgi:hypothetical protein